MAEETNKVEEKETNQVEKKEDKKNTRKPSKKTLKQLVKEVVGGAHGTGRERMLSLGDRYEEVQHEVNQLIKKGEIK